VKLLISINNTRLRPSIVLFKRLNAEMEERGEGREEKRAVSLQPASSQQPKNFIRETSGLCINGKKLTIVRVAEREAAKILRANSQLYC
jgi:hypothetical protein